MSGMNPGQESPTTPRRWIVSAPFDLTILLVPFAASLLSLATLGIEGRALPLWAFLIVIVAFDVAHVWATVYVTYLDREELRRRRLLYLLPIPLSFLVAWRLHSHSPTLFWTLLAYVAIYHFIRQQYGFIALYKARAHERSRIDFYLDKWTLWVGALGPVLLWHASPARQFDWFNAGEFFIFNLDPALKIDVVVIMALFAGAYAARQVQRKLVSGEVNVGKILWMAFSWISWSVGICLADHPLVSAAFLNLFHGIPFIGLVWYRCNRRWEGQEASAASPLLAWLSQRRNWIAFYAVILVPAVLEEALWDGIVWKVYLPSLLTWESPSSAGVSFWVALLSVPQIVHYYLDAWVWKLDGSNPDLHATLDL